MGIKLSAIVKVKHNYNNFRNIAQRLPKATSEGIEEMLKNIQGYAIRLERGHKSEGILVEMIDMSTQEIKGRVYAKPDKFMGTNNQSYLWFEYFGTGSKAEMPHIGTTEHFKQSGYTEWYIPVQKVGRSLPYPIITIKGEQFYVAHGVKSNHFLTDAEFKSRNENKDIVNEKINEMLKEVCK